MSDKSNFKEYKIKTGWSGSCNTAGYAIYVNGRTVVKTPYQDIFLLVAKHVAETTGLDVEKMAQETIKNPNRIGVKK